MDKSNNRKKTAHTTWIIVFEGQMWNLSLTHSPCLKCNVEISTLELQCLKVLYDLEKSLSPLPILPVPLPQLLPSHLHCQATLQKAGVFVTQNSAWLLAMSPLFHKSWIPQRIRLALRRISTLRSFQQELEFYLKLMNAWKREDHLKAEGDRTFLPVWKHLSYIKALFLSFVF